MVGNRTPFYSNWQRGVLANLPPPRNAHVDTPSAAVLDAVQRAAVVLAALPADMATKRDLERVKGELLAAIDRVIGALSPVLSHHQVAGD
jgi:hypothetical protein